MLLASRAKERFATSGVRWPSLTGFEVAGGDQKFFPAEARIVGNEVVISSAQVPSPVAARYAWADDPKCTLYNKAGLPGLPFRTRSYTLKKRRRSPPAYSCGP